jgi:ABC-type multidrug transport system fused ATPase/permease subunit
MKDDIWNLIKRFCIKTKVPLTFYVVLSALAHAIETLVIPKLLARIFTSVNDFVALRTNIIYFLVVFSVQKLLYVGSNFMSKRIEPTLTGFLNVEFIEAVFKKYEATHLPIDVTITMEKITIIRTILEDMIYYVYKLVPVLLILIITIITVFMLNYKLGFFVLGSAIILITIVLMIKRPKDDTHERDALYRYIEDIFQNMDLISSTENGIDVAKKAIMDKSAHLRRNKMSITMRVGINQAIGYFTATVLYVGAISYLYVLYKRGEVSVKNFEAYILTLANMYRLIFDMAYYLPDFMRGLQMLKNNGYFINELFSYKSKGGIDCHLANYDINLNEVSFGFGDNILLDKFSYTIKEGDLLALYGASGSGKTTFTQLILDILQPNEGEIKIGEYSTKELSKKSIRHHIANLCQNTTSLLQTTIYENIIYGFEDSEELRARVEELVTQYEIGRIFNDPNFLDITVRKGGTSLSGGQKAMIHLCHVLIDYKFKILILDEPTSALDPISKSNVMRLIKDLNNKGKTILIITHDDEVRDMCKSFLNFRTGKNPVIMK